VAVFTDAERVEVWDRRQAGELNRSIGRYELCLTTDQKVEGSSPSGRARVHLNLSPLSQVG
jgi:hypothetical protein